ncbi:MAG: antibiotic biosynthesis monooxygenase [Gammaproteobacteria bacterium]|jgi:heme-degrading monooxygenase HmoA
MAGYACIWEFYVDPGHEADFLRHYGPGGSWERLFRQAPGYIETLLLHDRESRLRYITIDRWRSLEDYKAFRRDFAGEYLRLDEQCAALTTRETSLGEYES